MSTTLNELTNLLEEYGTKIVTARAVADVKSTACIDKHVPSVPGVYWIETTMPMEEMRAAISEVLGRNKRLRKSPPRGTSRISQSGDELYVVYSGTEDDINRRLKQHLFNQGHADTVKLGCVISEEPFSHYKWRVRFHEVDSYIFRYAVEAWWRSKYGWPAFCLK